MPLSKEKKFSTPVLAMTLIVTMIGSNSSIGAITEIHKDGIIYPLYLTIRLLGVFFLIQYAMHFMVRRYSTAISLYGIIEQEYGAFSAKFSSTLSALYSVAVLSIQMIGMGYITKIFLGIPFNLGVIGTGVVFIIYSSISGIRGVVYTDVLQFFIILIVFPILVGVIVYNVGDLKAVFTNLPQEKMLVLEHKNFTEYTYLSLFWLMPFEFLQATVIQRILMCKDGKEIQRMGLSWVLFSSVFIFMVTILGLASIKLVPSYITGKEVITVLMRDFLPIGLKGVAITAFLAVIMSSADSVLNAATVLVAEITMSQKEREEQQQNGFQFSAKDELTEKEKKKKESFWLKISSVLLGSMSMAFALLDFSFIRAITISSAIAFAAVNIPVSSLPHLKIRNKKPLKLI
jgi:SSS family solute:Na+ symporter